MPPARNFILVLALILAVPCLVRADQSIAEYRAELDRLLTATENLNASGEQIQSILNSVPPSWHVNTEHDTFEISSEWLRSDLGELTRKYDQSRVNGIRDRLLQQRADLDAFEKPAVDISRQRAQLSNILNRAEFSSIHGQTWLDRLKQRLVELLVRFLGRAITSSVFSTVGKYFVYALIVLAVLALGYWVLRSIRSSTRVESILPESIPVSARAWTVWLADARAAAQQGNWREAIHLAYWAGISLLESQGMWRPDSARTPREYLRLIPAANEHRTTLATLTRKFELVWYANQSADEQAFAQTMAELEKLGCR